MGRVNGRMEIGMIRKMLPHATLIVAVMFVVFFCIDRVNEAMNFLGADHFQMAVVDFLRSFCRNIGFADRFAAKRSEINKERFKRMRCYCASFYY